MKNILCMCGIHDIQNVKKYDEKYDETVQAFADLYREITAIIDIAFEVDANHRQES